MTEDKKPEPTMLYSLKNLNEGKKAVVDRKKISCYTLVTEDVEGAKKRGWKDLGQLIEEYEKSKK